MNHTRSIASVIRAKQLLVLLVVMLCCAGTALAGELASPKGLVLLTVTGKIGRANDADAARFDEAMLSSLPQYRIVTRTPWTDGVRHFEGFRLRDLLNRVYATGNVIRAEAINGYRIEIPVSDAENFGVLIAMRMDGKPLLRRDKGPLWIVYPRDDVPAIQDDRYDPRWVWQLDKIDIR